MTIRRLILAYLASGLVVAAMDATWITLTGPTLYRPALHALLAPGFRFPPAVLFYLIYLVGVCILAIAPAIGQRRWTTAAGLGALFGLCAYATYDLTNQATMTVWSTRVTVIDMAWGTVLTATGATAGYLASKLIRR
jgi:uncharacterized membrane protein